MLFCCVLIVERIFHLNMLPLLLKTANDFCSPNAAELATVGGYYESPDAVPKGMWMEHITTPLHVSTSDNDTAETSSGIWVPSRMNAICVRGEKVLI
jgi:hypothetical protein